MTRECTRICILLRNFYINLLCFGWANMTVIQVCGINSCVCTSATPPCSICKVLCMPTWQTRHGKTRRTYLMQPSRLSFPLLLTMRRKSQRECLLERKSHRIDSNCSVTEAETTRNSITRRSISTGGNKYWNVPFFSTDCSKLSECVDENITQIMRIHFSGVCFELTSFLEGCFSWIASLELL